MSRLNDLIHRFTAQRDVLNHGLKLLEERSFGSESIAVELGLGSGRTYDHLRSALGSTPLYAFDFRVETHPGYEPPEDRTILGDILETFPRFAEKNRGRACFVHLDIGTKDKSADRRRYVGLLGWIESITAPGAILASDRELKSSWLAPVEIQSRLNWPYFCYEKLAQKKQETHANGTSIASNSEASLASISVD